MTVASRFPTPVQTGSGSKGLLTIQNSQPYRAPLAERLYLRQMVWYPAGCCPVHRHPLPCHVRRQTGLDASPKDLPQIEGKCGVCCWMVGPGGFEPPTKRL